MNAKGCLRSKWTIGIGSVVLLYTLVGFFLVPAIIKWQLLKRLPALTHRVVAVEQIKLNPYALSFTMRGFSLTETNGAPFVSLGELYVHFAPLTSAFKRGIAFNEISLKEPAAAIVYLPDGTFNFSNLIPTNSAPAAAPASAPGPGPQAKQQLPLLIIVELSIQAGAVSFTDLHRPVPFQQHVGPINIRLSHFTTRPKAGSPYSIVATTDTGETFSWSGDVDVAPPSSSGAFTISGFQINRYAPYIQDAAHVDVLDGRVDFHTDYRFNLINDTMTFAVSNAALVLTSLQVGVTQPKPAKAVVERLRLVVSDIAFDSTAKNVSVGEIRLAELNAGATLLPVPAGSKPTNAAPPAAAPPAAVEPSPPPATPTGTNQPPHLGGFKVQVGAVVIDDATLRFTDESIEPHVTSAIEKINGSIKGLTSDLNTAAAVDFKGNVNGFAPFTIAGQLNPLAKDLFVDLGILFQDVGLTAISPYMAKYAGYPLEKGSLSLDLHYYVTQKELKAKNNVRVDQLHLGPPSGSPDATKLPVTLAIALLQDRHGVISLDVPVTGRLDDPKFKVFPIVCQVFMNIIIKAATKPFALLGSMFGGGQDLSFIGYATGSSEFAEGEINKLDSLATALYERPALHLVITGSIDPVQDRQALAALKVQRQLKTLRVNELSAAGQKISNVDTVVLDPQDHDRLMKLAYAQAMGLVSANGSASGEQSAVLEHLTTRQNFGPLRPAAPPPTAQAGAAGPTGAVTVADMEKYLQEKAVITPADFQQLMQDRANKVQAYLLQTGKVTADRISVAAPKVVDAAYQGHSRADLGLQ
jgi:hypothetical protein